jgi:hypothetical protein
MDQIIISNKEFNDLLDLNLDYLRDYFKGDKQTDYYPTLLLFSRTARYEKLQMTIAVLADEAFDEKKYQIVSLAGIKFGADQPASEYIAAAYLCSEAWIRRFKKGEALPGHGRLDGYDDKIEVIGCIGMTVDGRGNFGTFKVRRDKKNRIFDLKAYQRQEYKETDTGQQGVRSDLLQAFWRGYATGKLKKRFGDDGNKEEMRT